MTLPRPHKTEKVFRSQSNWPSKIVKLRSTLYPLPQLWLSRPWRNPHATGRRLRTSNTMATLPWMISWTPPELWGQGPCQKILLMLSLRSLERLNLLVVLLMVRSFLWKRSYSNFRAWSSNKFEIATFLSQKRILTNTLANQISSKRGQFKLFEKHALKLE